MDYHYTADSIDILQKCGNGHPREPEDNIKSSLCPLKCAEDSIWVLEERGEGRPGEHGQGLLQGLDLVVAGSLPQLKVLQSKVAALVQVCVLVHQLLKLAHH